MEVKHEVKCGIQVNPSGLMVWLRSCGLDTGAAVIDASLELRYDAAILG